MGIVAPVDGVGSEVAGRLALRDGAGILAPLTGAQESAGDLQALGSSLPHRRVNDLNMVVFGCLRREHGGIGFANGPFDATAQCSGRQAHAHSDTRFGGLLSLPAAGRYLGVDGLTRSHRRVERGDRNEQVLRPEQGVW
jgi:hypothetical protein